VKSARPVTLPERDQPFRDFVGVLTAGAWDPPNHKNIDANILKMSARGQLRVKEWVSNVMIDRIKPCIAGDIWSDRGCSLMGINLYGISKRWVMDEWLAAATPFGTTRHTGAAIDSITVEALKRAGISWSSQSEVYEGVHGKISDNASNMAKDWAGFEGGFCNAHTIELSVHKYTEHERIKPTYSRMRGIVGYFNKSTNGIQDLTTIQKELSLPEKSTVQDVITRWRSGYDMSTWFREQQQSVITFDIRHAAEAGDVYKANRLELSDWTIIKQSVSVLATSANVTTNLTTNLEGTKYVTISSVLPFTYRMLAELEATQSLYLPWKTGAQQWLSPASMRTEVKEARAEFHDDLYERYITSMPAARKETLAICTLLDLRYKEWGFIGATASERIWTKGILEATFEDAWQPADEAKEAESAPAVAAAAGTSKAAAKAVETSALSIFERPMGPGAAVQAAAHAPVEQKTDLEKYLLLPQEPMDINILEWWKLRDHDKPADPELKRPHSSDIRLIYQASINKVLIELV
jgi:hypothetical protein